MFSLQQSQLTSQYKIQIHIPYYKSQIKIFQYKTFRPNYLSHSRFFFHTHTHTHTIFTHLHPYTMERYTSWCSFALVLSYLRANTRAIFTWCNALPIIILAGFNLNNAACGFHRGILSCEHALLSHVHMYI